MSAARRAVLVVVCACGPLLSNGTLVSSSRTTIASSVRAILAAEADDAAWARVSRLGTIASEPAVAYNPNAREFLVVWAEGDIYGQRIDATTGAEVGPDDFRISSMRQAAANPAVAFNASANQYLVVWDGDGDEHYTFRQVWGQVVSAAGEEIGHDELIGRGPGPLQGRCVACFRWELRFPSLTFNPITREYLVVFRVFFPYIINGEDIRALEEIGVARVDESGVVLARSGFAAERDRARCCVRGAPTVARNAQLNEYVVVWPRGGTLFGQAIRADGIALSSFQVSGPVNAFEHAPGLVWNPVGREFLVTWAGVRDGRLQVMGQRLSADGQRVGTPDFSISTNANYWKERPKVAYAAGEYLVVWNEWGAGLPSGQAIRGQRLLPTGLPIDPDGISFTSNMGIGRGGPGVAVDTARAAYAIATSANMPSMASGTSAIFARAYTAPQPLVVGLGRGGAGRLQSWATGSGHAAHGADLLLPWPAYVADDPEIHPAVGNIDGDPLNEVVVGLGIGGQGWIAVFDDADHRHGLLRWIQIPWPSYNAVNGAVWPAVGDVDGDGRAEIVAGLGNMGQGFFAVFDDANRDHAFVTWRRIDWPGYNARSGETHPAVANIDGGLEAEIVIGLGRGGGGWLAVFGGAASGFAQLQWLRVGWHLYTTGSGETYPAGGDVDGDGFHEVVVGLGTASEGWVEVFDDARQELRHKAWIQVSWSDYAASIGETHPAVGDIDGDPAMEIVLGLSEYPGSGGYFEVRDDASASYRSMGWYDAGGPGTFRATGATFPALGANTPRRW